ncbi:IclR family transcriptional regulator [Allokutzneria sp. A3M-2-11 16]|uniref:IclR family transcriptional regulator n=1 Tax=Allokutzneria sp. A3M-2-11 16 TaxID=2962043 RepID=UPI0020B6E4F9|nr:IclR family transcriptional regulator [Allokutzneria sp. A3M-2-11 16]MCP3803652.1 IclR family transcriptional regulator [Allokutzneria sp. A3M-2-11 16]
MSEGARSTAARLLAALEAISNSRDGLTVAEFARALGRDKSIASRQLRPLVDLGVLERGPDGRHRLGWRLFTLAARAGDQRLLLLAPPVMRRLSDLSGERVHLSVLHGREVLTILSESSRQMIEAVDWVGRTAPVHCTSSGRVLLFDHRDDDVRCLLGDERLAVRSSAAPATAEDFLRRLCEARKLGYALVDGEFDVDLVAAAAPVRDFSGRIVASINVSAPAYRLKERLWHTGRQVASAAAHLSKAISSQADH